MLRSIALAGALALACVPSVARELIVIRHDPGGDIERFIGRYERIRASGDFIAIDGACESACTLLTGIVPPDRVCVTAHGWLGFHSAFLADGKTGENLGYSAKWTRRLWSVYPKSVRAAIRRHGWDGRSPHPDIIPIRGEELRSIVRPCGE